MNINKLYKNDKNKRGTRVTQKSRQGLSNADPWCALFESRENVRGSPKTG